MEAILEGTWQMIRAEQAGETAPDLVAAKTRISLAGGEYVVRFDGHVADRGTFTVGPDAMPRTLSLRGEEGPNAGRLIPCIFQLMGDRLRVCFGFEGVRPAEFATRAGDGCYLATYRRLGA